MTGPLAGRQRLDLVAGLGLALGLGVLSAVQPALGVLALAGAAVLAVSMSWPPILIFFMFAGILFDRLGVTGAKLGDFPVTASKLSVVGGLGVWTLLTLLDPGKSWRWHRVLGGLGALVATTAVTIATAGSLEHGKFTLYGLVMMGVMVALVYAVTAEARLAPLYRLLGTVLLAATLASVLRPGSGEGDRATGTMGDPNEWATTVLLTAPLLLGGLVGDPTPLGRLLRTALVLAGPLAVLRSESRAALVTLILTSPGWIWLLRRRAGELGVAGAVALLGAPLLIDLEAGMERLQNLLTAFTQGSNAEDSSFTERSELFRQGVQLFADNWVLGAGPGNFEYATGFVSHEGLLRPAHNTYLEIASEQGVVGLFGGAVLFATVALTLREGWRVAAAHREPEGRERVAGAAIGLGAFALMAATLGLLTFAMGYLALGLTLAVVHQAAGRRGHVA